MASQAKQSLAENTTSKGTILYGPALDFKYPKVKIYTGHLGPRLGQGNRTMLRDVRKERTVLMITTWLNIYPEIIGK